MVLRIVRKSRSAPRTRGKAGKRQPRRRAPRRDRFEPILGAPVSVGSNVQLYRSPALSTNGNTCRISHREYLTPVTSTTTDFTVFKFYLNPGVASTFPWLYYIANNFELYKFLKLQFEYLPRCSSASFGSVTIAIDYDAADSAPLTKSEVIMFATQKTSSVWQPMRDRKSVV